MESQNSSLFMKKHFYPKSFQRGCRSDNNSYHSQVQSNSLPSLAALNCRFIGAEPSVSGESFRSPLSNLEILMFAGLKITADTSAVNSRNGRGLGSLGFQKHGQQIQDQTIPKNRIKLMHTAERGFNLILAMLHYNIYNV